MPYKNKRDIHARTARSFSPDKACKELTLRSMVYDGPKDSLDRDVLVTLNAEDTAFLLEGITEVFGIDRVRAALDLIESKQGRLGRIPVAELRGDDQ